MAYNRRRWGSDGWTYSLPGKRDGSKFRNWKVWPNTLHASRLIHLAGERGGWELQHKAKGLVFELIYERGENASDLKVLVNAAKELGLEGAEGYLTSGEGVSEVKREAKEASRAGIGGVPFFVVYQAGDSADPITFSGAQPVKTFLQCLKQLSK
mmetsp:Transcript_37603/g.77251  ORF Transcript_37603/g.77251 Transcript_37603/m.77251 type:complete len:154 (-) Transcript_37603:21-482(-)